jgi:hypothetical protein
MATKMSEEDLALMTEEERAGYLEEEEDDGAEGEGGDGTEVEALPGTEGGKEFVETNDKPNEGEGDGGEGDGTVDLQSNERIAADKLAADAAAAAAAKADDDAAAAAAAAAAAPERKPNWILPPEVETRIKTIEEQRDALAAKWDDGEITAQEKRALEKPLEAELDDLKGRKIAASVAKDNAIATWSESTVPDFITAHPEYKAGTRLNAMLDAEVRRLQTETLNPLDPKLLEKAHKTISDEIKSAFGVKDVPKVPGKTPPGKTPGKRETVPSLAHVPAADITDADDGGEFAYLDRLSAKSSIDFEKELAKLSPEKYDRYMQQ